MKHIAAVTLALTISGSSIAFAGDLSAPVMEQAIVVEDAAAGSSSSAVTIVALTGLFMLAVVASN